MCRKLGPSPRDMAVIAEGALLTWHARLHANPCTPLTLEQLEAPSCMISAADVVGAVEQWASVAGESMVSHGVDSDDSDSEARPGVGVLLMQVPLCSKA